METTSGLSRLGMQEDRALAGRRGLSKSALGERREGQARRDARTRIVFSADDDERRTDEQAGVRGSGHTTDCRSRVMMGQKCR